MISYLLLYFCQILHCRQKNKKNDNKYIENVLSYITGWHLFVVIDSDLYITIQMDEEKLL